MVPIPVLRHQFPRHLLLQTPSPSNIDPTPSDKEGVAVAAIEGSWLSHINIDGARYWSITKEVPDAWRPVPDPLPSDSRYRQVGA